MLLSIAFGRIVKHKQMALNFSMIFNKKCHIITANLARKCADCQQILDNFIW